MPATTGGTREKSMSKTARVLLMFLTSAALVLGMALGAQGTASAATANCGDGRCVVYLSKSETVALGQGRAPALPAAAPWQVRASYFALVQGHRFIAQQYGNRGWCSAFLLSVRPWENQGYTGYRC
ncbi:MAG: hypothetical protein L0H03_05305 [Rhodococcus sp. (in: high G+C Gram-positive bacteria)]|uniref:hypothetical protein n=1 Tax=Rhodococcus qingshengii TaxID=334542 RepID=UPI000E4FA20D|nr:hypothetical protein [Rhodococcus qingshengii]MDN5544671.1 hypothetical protein [Rhodococcus sp. (in: high G+C Gram-positive bacteria)]RGP45333.1 hypothetical protein AWH04_28390 [Rhodococcus erythropolis]